MAEEQDKEKQGPGQPTKYDDVMPARADLFLEKRKQDNTLPTRAGLAVFLGVCKTTLENWAEKYPEFLGSLGKLKAIQEDDLITRGLKSEYNSTICKLMLSSNHGYCERTDTTTGGEKIEPTIVNFADAMEAVKPKDPEAAKPETATNDSQ